MCHSKNSKFIKEEESSRLVSSLGIKTSLNGIPLVGPVLVQRYYQDNTRNKMNEKVNNFLLAEDIIYV